MNYPTIIIHGSGMSDVFLHCAQGERVTGANGKHVRGGFGGLGECIDHKPLLKHVVPRALLSLLFRHDAGLSRSLRRGLKKALAAGHYQYDNHGRHSKDFRVIALHRIHGEVPTSFAELPEENMGYVNRMVPMQSITEGLGAHRMYYFAYDTMGNHADVVDELHQFIQDVLQKHGVEKVNLMPMSLGATLMNALAEYYPAVHKQLHKVLYFVPAFNGSAVVGDIFLGRMTIYDKQKRLAMLRKQSKAGAFVLRLMPERAVRRTLDTALEGAVGGLFSRATMLWALLPQEDYAEASARWLSDPDLAPLKEQTDRYYNAQVNAAANIKAMQAQGVQLYNINEYNTPLPSLFDCSEKLNGDGIIDLHSTSLGATSVGIDTPLAADYLANADPKYISPDGMVDASTGALPDTTWYVKGVHHDRTGKDERITRLAGQIMLQTQPITCHMESFGFPQYM
jgi:pimeloyl-ACP methyl ester carboxylesterase